MRREEIIAIQKELNVAPDGFWGPRSIAASQAFLRRLQNNTGLFIPEDKEEALIGFYGPPGEIGGKTPPLQRIKLPFVVYFAKQPVETISVHEKIAGCVEAAFEYLKEAFPSEKDRAEAGVNIYDGCYNPRMMRGSKTRLSRHAWAIAIDINAAGNGNLTKWPERATMPWAAIKAFAKAGFMPAGPFWLRDAMHFQLTKI